jgi:hypothetical protein
MHLIVIRKKAALARMIGAGVLLLASVVAASAVSPAQRAVLNRYVAAA